MGISALLVTYNEEKRHLKECLQSLAWADEIVVVDSGSSDRTVEIARQQSAKVYHHAWQGFGPQKNWGIGKCRNDWILSIDADEIVGEGLAREIVKEINRPGAPAGFYLRISTYLGSRRIRCFEGLCLIRLFRKGRGEYDDLLTDETIKLQGPAAKLKGKIMHLGYDGYTEFISKFNYYTDLEAKKIYPQKIRTSKYFSGLVAVLEGLKVFLVFYFIRLGFLDGTMGLFVATYSLLYPMVSYFKAWEMQKGWFKS
ncbi:glycosyltransferase family 2 protein [candidate division TA06 bacterium]|nr:glycosyltransferase family 2 protein [candidate division TA06 bacterium]